MKLINLQIVFLLVSIAYTCPLLSQERTWRDVTGTFQVKAELLSVSDDKVVLKKHNGNVIRVPLSKLSPADLDYLKDLSQKSSTSLAPESSGANELATPKTNPKPAVGPASTEKSTNKAAAANSKAAGRKLGATERQNDTIPPIEIPSIKVTDEQIGALPKSVRAIAAVLHDGSDPVAIRNALTELSKKWPGNNETILNLVRKSTLCDEKYCRLKSLALLCKHDLINSFPFILARMDDRSFDVRWAAMEYIERSADPRAMKPLVDRFIGPDRAKISVALMTYGTKAEPYLQKYLEHRRSDVRMETSLLLGKLGTDASVPHLEKLVENDPNPVVALQAKSAIRSINKRLADPKN